MTDYNDGKWHGWNGGECPVDPGTTVEVWYDLDGIDDSEENIAFNVDWSNTDPSDWRLIRFRVLKPTEPAPPADPLAALTARVERLEAILTKEATE
jgi:hypothetical protein